MLYMTSWIGLLAPSIDSKVSDGRIVALGRERSEKVILNDTSPFYRFQQNSQEVNEFEAPMTTTAVRRVRGPARKTLYSTG